MGPCLSKRFSTLLDILGDCGKNGLLICYSGGIDSTLLVAAAQRAGVARLLALTFATPTVALFDLDTALSVASELSIAHRILEVNTLTIPQLIHNTQERCYYCKLTMYQQACLIAKEEDYACIADGCNAEDLHAYRPGNQAASRLNIRHPLSEAKLSKAQIRLLGRELGLPNADRPSSPCLASRFPYNTKLTRKNLARVEKGEAILRENGLREFRLRLHGDLARLEVKPHEVKNILNQKENICTSLHDLGFHHITLDLEDLLSGSFDR